MRLSLRQKQTFYQELGQFLRSGIPLPQAVEALLPETPRGPVRQALERLQMAFKQGESVAGAFGQLRPATISEMEAALIDAAASSGRLDQAFVYLIAYFESLATVREQLRRQITWPLVQLHLAVLILGMPQLVTGDGLGPYLKQTASAFLMLYGLAACLGAAVFGLVRWGQAAAGADLWLRRVPLFGALRRNLALSRFCAVYEMQLQAAINVMDGLRAAASASQSALVRRDVERAIPRVLQGERAGIALTGSPAFPAALQRALRLGEETGSLDEGLRQWSEYYREAALRNLTAIGNWLPRILFLLIAVYVGYVVVSVYYRVSVEPLNDLLKQ